MPRKKFIEVGISEPVRILETSYHLVSIDPLVGILEFEVDNGFVALGMNRAVAEQVREMVEMFLAESPNAPTPPERSL